MPTAAFLLEPYGGRRQSAPLWSSIPTAEARRALLRGELSLPRVTAQVVGKGAVPDFFVVGDPAVLAVSDRFADSLRSLSGVTFTPFEIEGYPERRWVLSVTGRCGQVDFRKADVVCHLSTFVQLKGMSLTSADANADLSIPGNYDAILLSHHAAEVIRAQRFENVSVEPLSEFRIDLPPEMIESRSPR